MNLLSTHEESKARIRHNFDERFFDYVQAKVAVSSGTLKGVEFGHDPVHVREVVNTSCFESDIAKNDRFKSARWFDPRDYYVSRINEHALIIYRDRIPAGVSTLTSGTAYRLKYDPTNGIRSDGFHFRLIQP